MLDRVREALFSVLAKAPFEAHVWDLFAGTGALGLEALSRGAKRVFFVERNHQALRALRANLSRCIGSDEEKGATIMSSDAWRPDSSSMGRPDLVFLDPPYPQVKSDPTMVREQVLAILGQLNPNGTLVFHYEAELPLAGGALHGLELDERRWGTSMVALIPAPVLENE